MHNHEAAHNLEVFRLATLGELAAVRAPWNDLHDGVPFRSWEWLDCWWRHYGGNARGSRELFTLSVFADDGAMIGLAPWYVERTASQARVIRFLGSGEICSDYLGVLCKSGDTAIVAQALADWLAHPPNLADWLATDSDREWDLIELGAVSPDDRVTMALVDQLAERGFLVHRRPGPNCWRIELPATWDEYLGMLSKSHRKQVRRCERRYFERGRTRLCRAANFAEVEHGLSILTELHGLRRAACGQRGVFASSRFAAFHRDVSLRLLDKGLLNLVWLELDGRPVAAEYQICGLNRVVYAYQSGIHPAALDDEPGRLITIALLREAIEAGRPTYDFLRGNEAYKAHWRATPQATCDIRILPNTGAARWRHNLWMAGDSVRSWIKTGLKFSGIGLE